MKSLIAIAIIGSFVVLATAGAAGAQTWNTQIATEAISGTAYDTTETAALVLSGTKIYYCDYQGQNSPPATNVGEVTELYRFPVCWNKDESALYYANDPSASPTHKPINVSGSVSAVAYYVNGSTTKAMWSDY